MQGSIYRHYFRYTVPTIAAMLVNGLYQLVDGIFIGQYVGSSGLAAINIAWALTGTCTGVGLMIGVGTGSLTSIRKGEQDLHAARQTLSTGLMLCLIMAVLITLFLWQFARQFLSWQTDDPLVLSLGWDYLKILSFNSLFMLGAIAMPFLMRNDDSPNRATLLMVLGAGLNILFDYLFIGVFGWQLTGAGVATSLSQAVVTLLALHYFFSPAARIRLTRADFRFHVNQIGPILLIGTSSFFMYLYWGVMVGMHNSQFAHYGGTQVIAAYAILGYIVTFYYLTVEGIANGMQPLASYSFGAKQYGNIFKLLKVAMFLAIALGVLVLLLLNLYPDPIIAIFNRDSEVVSGFVKQGIVLHLFVLFLDGFLVVATAYYQSINHGRKAMAIAIGNILVQPPFLYILPKYWGLTGVWLAFPLSNILISLLVVGMMFFDLKKMVVRL